MGNEAILHVPEGINFDCTGCGNCCFGWPVPLTDDDVHRLKTLTVAPLQRPQILKIAPSANSNQTFTAALGKRADGFCQYLSPDNRCEIHSLFGEESKPGMCQLFPYTFTETPAGVYASASFASTGVLFNSGRALNEQRSQLLRSFELFKKLFPRLSPDWSSMQLIDGEPLTFESYLEIEADFLTRLERHDTQRVEKFLADLAKEITQNFVKNIRDFDVIPGMQTKARTVDSLLVAGLIDTYFPNDVYKDNLCDLDSATLARNLVMPPEKVTMSYEGTTYGFGQLNSYKLGALSPEGEDLLRRFAYVKVFSKLYFSAGFADLSLIAGLNHLSLIISLVRIVVKLRNVAAETPGNEIPFEELAEVLRKLERRLTVANFSAQAKTILEVLLSSSARSERVSQLAS